MSWWSGLGLALPVAFLAAGCDSTIDLHSFWAARYNSTSDCLETMSVIDVLDGASSERCIKVVCWFNPHTSEAYVSEVMCDGPPDWIRYESTGSGTVCDQALEARARSDGGKCSTTAADGGSD